MSALTKLVLEPSSLMLLEDTRKDSGRELFDYFLCKWFSAQKDRNLVIVAFDKAPTYYGFCKGVPDTKKKAVIVDCFSNPLNWDDPQNDEWAIEEEESNEGLPAPFTGKSVCTDVSDLDKLFHTIEGALSDDQHNVVVIDSLSSILIRHGFNKTALLLNRLLLALKSKQKETTTTSTDKQGESGKEKEKERENENDREKGKGKGKGEEEESNEEGEGGSSILAFVHLDFHQKSPLLVKNVEYLADTVVKMSTYTGVSPSTDGGVAAIRPAVSDERRCEILNKRQSGRVSREVQTFKVDKQGVVTLSRAKKFAKVVPVAEEESKPDPTKNLTFSLTRTSEEEAAKRSVVLPYTQAAGSAVLPIDEQGGADDFGANPEDWEDEFDDDPDGDLDI